MTAKQPCPTPKQGAIYEASRRRLRALYGRDQYEIHCKVLAWHDTMKSKYPDARDYLMYHLISGSTYLGFNGCFDFPGDDSVEHFINTEFLEAFPDRHAILQHAV